MPTYKQGDVVVVNFPFTDISQTKKRPALVISNDAVNQTGDYLFSTDNESNQKRWAFASILTTDFEQNPLPLTSFVRLHKIFLLNESLIIKKSTAITSSFYQTLVSNIVGLIQ